MKSAPRRAPSPPAAAAAAVRSQSSHCAMASELQRESASSHRGILRDTVVHDAAAGHRGQPYTVADGGARLVGSLTFRSSPRYVRRHGDVEVTLWLLKTMFDLWEAGLQLVVGTDRRARRRPRRWRGQLRSAGSRGVSLTAGTFEAHAGGGDGTVADDTVCRSRPV